MNVSLKWLLLFAVAATCLLWVVGAQSTSQADNEYRTCVQLVQSHELDGTVDGCKAERELVRSLH